MPAKLKLKRAKKRFVARPTASSKSKKKTKSKHFPKALKPSKPIKIKAPEAEEPKTEVERMKAALDKAFGPKGAVKEIAKQRKPLVQALENAQPIKRALRPGFVRTGVPGLDDLLVDGVPKGASVIVAGGPGSGKTILCLQVAFEAAKAGEKALYLSFEESEERLVQHMKSFGWDVDPLMKKRLLIIKRVFPLDIKRSVDALLAKAKGELMIDVPPILLPDNEEPDKLVIDSLTAIASTFVGTEETYRIYIEQLFRFLEKLKATSFLITETENLPMQKYSQTGVEEFLADGVIVLYNLRKGAVRETAIEVLKMRGVNHKKRIAAMRITEHGIDVFPDQEVFGEIA